MSERDRLTDAALRRMDNVQLEVERLAALRQGDELFEPILRHLVLRGMVYIERVCRRRGQRLGLSRRQIGLAIEDAGAQLPLRLGRRKKLPSVEAIAARLAGEAIATQQAPSLSAPQLVDARPQLRLIGRDGKPISPNNWRNS